MPDYAHEFCFLILGVVVVAVYLIRSLSFSHRKGVAGVAAVSMAGLAVEAWGLLRYERGPQSGLDGVVWLVLEPVILIAIWISLSIALAAARRREARYAGLR